jgi:hypothetical protein
MDAPAQENTADHFVVCLMRKRKDMFNEAEKFFQRFEEVLRASGGKVQQRTCTPKNWVVIDGQDNWKQPNHLSPAIFDFDAVIIGAFKTQEELMTWWSSDEMFSLIKARQPIEKLGIYALNGLQQAYDVSDRNKIHYGEKFVFVEFIKMQAFKPVQHYVDCYKRYAERALQEIGIDCSLLFAEGVSVMLMSEFPLEAICASTWRMRMDVNFWCDAEIYQKQLLPLRQSYSTSVAMVLPIHESLTCECQRKQELGRNVLGAIQDRKPAAIAN